MRTKTEQELFWEGEFGAEYTHRNSILPEQRQPFFSTILEQAGGIATVCELGANRGHNLEAIARLNPTLKLTGVELNESACQALKSLPGVNAVLSSIQDFQPAQTFDLVFTCGVLIHVHPSDLPGIYQKMYELSARYILINEYFNPVPVEVNYRGHTGKLFKRDFAGELIDAYPHALKVVDYGFLWRRMSPGWDDTTWVLLEKVAQ